jgi:putative tricarboxylic transport membrane protein
MSQPRRSVLNVLKGTWGEAAFTVMLPLFAGLYIWQAMQVTEPPSNISIGPRTFPLLVGWAMLATSLLLCWKLLVKVLRGQASQDAFVPAEDEETAIRDWLAVAVVVGVIVFLCAALEPIGFVVSIFIFLSVLSNFFSPKRWITNTVISMLFSVFFYWLFTRVLEIPLPNGILTGLF